MAEMKEVMSDVTKLRAYDKKHSVEHICGTDAEGEEFSCESVNDLKESDTISSFYLSFYKYGKVYLEYPTYFKDGDFEFTVCASDLTELDTYKIKEIRKFAKQDIIKVLFNFF